MQTILGSGGAIGKELAKELIKFTDKVRLVSRTPEKVNESDELFSADLNDAVATSKAIEGSEVVYLVAGLPYKTKVWQQQWPQIMQNVINACKQHNSKLVFFDNVYLYDKNSLSNITESSPVNPPSKKGAVRKQIAGMLMEEVGSGSISAMIVRSADFYGPGVNSSFMMETVYKNLKKNKKPMWLGNASKIHSLTYVPDAARATALLGNTSDAYNQVWHLPTDSHKITGVEWVTLFTNEMQKPFGYKTMSAGFIKLAGIFSPFLGELSEMMYQFDRDYFFNSRKFQDRFPDFQTTSYKDGVRNTVLETT